MAEFSASSIVSPYTNQLFNTASGATGLELQQNALNVQKSQMDVAQGGAEQIARAANWVLTLPPEQRAGGYNSAVQTLRGMGLATNAPGQYPGDDAMQMYARIGTSSEKQWERQQNIEAAKSMYTPPDGSTAPAPGGGGALPPAPSAPGTGATIGQRQNNPGNLTFAGQPYATPGQGNRFASFPDMPTGVAANADQLALYQTQHGINTVRGAVTRWVGDPKADLTSYIGDISKSLGVKPDDPIDLTNPDVQAKFILAQFPHESAGGGYVLNPADVTKGVQIAAARRGQIVQPAPTSTAAAPGVPGTPGQPAPYQVATAGSTVPPPPGGAPGAPAAPASIPRVDSPGAPPPSGLKYNPSSQGAPAGTILGYLPNGNAILAGPTEARVGVTGWNADGTPIRSGAPSVPPAPAVAAVPTPTPTTTAAAPGAPGAPAAPAAAPSAPVSIGPPPTPPEPRQNNGYTAAQNQVLSTFQRQGDLKSLAAYKQQFDDNNRQTDATYATQARQYQQDQRQAQNDAIAREEKARADAIAAENLRLSQATGERDAERLRLAQEADARAAADAAIKARQAARPLQGNDIQAQHENVLHELTPKIQDGTATDAEKRLYAGSYYALQQSGGQATTMTDPNNPGSTIPAMITRRLPPSFPEPEGGALPLVMAAPGAAKQEQMTADQSKNASFADRLQQSLPIITDTSPAAMSRWQQLLGKAPLGNSMVSPEFQQHVQSERNFINAVLRRESGAAISESEFVNARQQYIPQPGDSPQVLAQKEANRKVLLTGMIRDAGPNYKPAVVAPAPAPADRPPITSFAR